MKIKTAYFYSKGTFVAKAFVQYADGLKNDRRTALGDTAEEAISGAVGYIQADFRKDGLKVPETIEHIGKIRRAFAEAWIF
ncbi:hypothetical protein [Rhizobium leguminosarum]|uniref:hypothetical protein n=1 Tax=Rhizobium leguminosarum TaxID=384 RepID=UPI001441A737|nr:hypothetical protein [Rhizobium leguminosarum]MBY5863247.1 hypothetical protein [Rhizobium leguminosarum]NKM04125.1 hypothetical protein [Rhizobium leguminosarum bv. viciae]